MAEQRGGNSRWAWEVPGFESRRSVEREEPRVAPLSRRYSLSAAYPSEAARHSIGLKLQKLKEQLKRARADNLELRQEASDLREYSNAKLERVTRYLGVLADRAQKLDQAAYESESRIAPLVNEKRRLFNDLVTAKGNIKVFCRTRPIFEDEGPCIVEYPDEYSIRINLGDDSFSNPKKDFEFDRVFGPHVGQGELFHDVQPFVQSAFDGFNVSIFAYGQTGSGKTHTMEGSSHDRGLYVRCFEELFDLSNADTTSVSQYDFYVTAFEIYNEQVHDLLLQSNTSASKISMGSPNSSIKLVQEKAVNPFDFSRILKLCLQSRGNDSAKFTVSHLIITTHIHYTNSITGEKMYSKLSVVDLAGSECLLVKDAFGELVKDYLHVSKSLSALGDVLSSLTAKKDIVPYENSRLTRILYDSLGGNAKTLMIATVCPDASNISTTLSTLSFSARARNAELSLGNRDTIKKWKDVANDARKELYEKEKEANDLRQEVLGLKLALRDANDQCLLLFSEVQKAWKVSCSLQADLKDENSISVDKRQDESEHSRLRDQVGDLLRLQQDQKLQIQERDLTIKNQQDKIKILERQLSDTLQSAGGRMVCGNASQSSENTSSPKSSDDSENTAAVTKKLEEELSKRDALIERLHQENEKLFDRLTEKSSLVTAAQASSPSGQQPNVQTQEMGRIESTKGQPLSPLPLPSTSDKTYTTGAIVKSGPEKKTTLAGEYLTAALTEFDPDQFESPESLSDGTNRLLMLVLAAVVKAGAAREHEILAEIRDAVFHFIRKMEPRQVMDTMLVSRVRVLYIRSLVARSPELQSIKVFPVERFLEKSNTGRSKNESRGSSPGRSPNYHDITTRNSHMDEQIQVFKVNIKQEKKSKFSSLVSKVRGTDQEMVKQHVTGVKLREITEEAKCFAFGNKSLAALFVHVPAGELQRQIKSWLAENFDFLSVTGGDSAGGGSGQLELLSTAIMDGWMAGLGTALKPSTDALGQLLSEYAKRVYSSQLQHLKDIAGTLATEAAEDAAHVSKLRSALESVDHKRKKILQQMRMDNALLSKEEGGSHILNPSTAAEDSRLASLISLDSILKQVKDIMRQSSTNSLTKSKKKSLLSSLDELLERMPSLLDIDQPCARRQIANARRNVESIPEEEDRLRRESVPSQSWTSSTETEVAQWNVLQFNTGSSAPFIIKCGANSNSELVVKADARVQDPKGGEIIRVAPKPTVLAGMSLDELKQVFSQLPEALSSLALARTADGTRARYSRVYRTLAQKVPALRDLE